MRPGAATIAPPMSGPSGDRGPFDELQERIRAGELRLGDEVREAGEHGRAEESRADTGDGASATTR